MLIRGVCVRALDHDGVSRSSTAGMTVPGFLAAMCNVSTAVWLIGMPAGSLLARRTFGWKAQIGHHAAIAAGVLVG